MDSVDLFGSAARPVVMGHRGAPLRAPENTPGSFEAAAREGATWVELDARRCAGDGVVVHHEPCTPDGVPLVDRTVEHLRALGVWSLEAVLERLPPGLGLDVELKNLPGEPDFEEDGRLAGLVAGVLGRVVGERPLLVTSFDPYAALAVTLPLPGVPAGLLTLDTLAVDAGTDLAVELGFSALCPSVRADGLDRAGVAAVHGAGLALLVWTVDEAARIRELADAGVDAICTNDPATAIRALDRSR
jgi:glycerophosphoryl diester phosphodiesterase